MVNCLRSDIVVVEQASSFFSIISAGILHRCWVEVVF
jgi:hypothetical protein